MSPLPIPFVGKTMVLIFLLLWLSCGILGTYCTKMTHITHPGKEIYFAWFIGVLLGPITLLIMMLER